MIKKTIATTLGLLLTTTATPAFAAPSQAQVDNHMRLLEYINNRDDISVAVNPVDICNENSFAGAYQGADGYAWLVICQDNRVSDSEKIVAWTTNDLDTIRHEAFHYVQDCYDNNISNTLTQVYDDIDEVIARDIARALVITYQYNRKAGLRDSKDIFFELEAFFAATNENAHGIADDVRTYCK